MKAVDESNLPQVKMMIGVLLRFWQVGLIEFDTVSKLSKLRIYIKSISDAEFAELKQMIVSHLGAHKRLTASKHDLSAQIALAKKGELHQIVIEREVNSLFRKEITIIVELITNYLTPERIFSDEFALIDDLISCEELDDLIIDALNDNTKLKLIGVRSDGRLAVYPAMDAD